MRRLFGNKPNGRSRVGVTNIVVSALSILACVLLVMVGDALEHRYALRADYSYNGITSIDRMTRDALANLQGDVHIYALFTPGQEDQALIGLLDRYAAASPRITYSLENLLSNPMLAATFSDLPEDNPVTTDSLVVYSKETGRSRVLDGTNYIEQSYDPESGGYAITGLTYEKSLTEAILFVTSDALPKVRLLTGHGELSGNSIAPLLGVLEDANIEVSTLNLMAGETLSPGDLLFILSPDRDLLAQELDAIRAFIAGGGSLLITTDYDAPDDLLGFAEIYKAFGFSLKPGIVVAEEAERASYYETPIYLMPYMENTAITADLIAANRTTLILPGARAFEIDGFTGDAHPVAILRSGAAYIRNTMDALSSLTKEATDETGTFTVALYSSIDHDAGQSARAFAIGSSATFTDAWLHTNTYSVELLMQALDALGVRTTISLDIEQKQAIRPPLTLGDSILPGILMTAAPLLVAVPAMLVYRSRKKKV